MESTLLWIIVTAVVTGLIGYVFSIAKGARDKRDTKIENLEARVRALELSMATLEHIKNSQDQLSADVKSMMNMLLVLQVQVETIVKLEDKKDAKTS